MKHRLSFGFYNVLPNNIVEVTTDEGIEISLEMVEESSEFLSQHITGAFAMLINQINNYTYSYEAQLSVGSYENLKAVAFVYYSAKGEESIKKLQSNRSFDQWDYPIFSGLELGWQQAQKWLENELLAVKTS
jgi:hypothetical protein